MGMWVAVRLAVASELRTGRQEQGVRRVWGAEVRSVLQYTRLNRTEAPRKFACTEDAPEITRTHTHPPISTTQRHT